MGRIPIRIDLLIYQPLEWQRQGKHENTSDDITGPDGTGLAPCGGRGENLAAGFQFFQFSRALAAGASLPYSGAPPHRRRQQGRALGLTRAVILSKHVLLIDPNVMRFQCPKCNYGHYR